MAKIFVKSDFGLEFEVEDRHEQEAEFWALDKAIRRLNDEALARRPLYEQQQQDKGVREEAEE